MDWIEELRQERKNKRIGREILFFSEIDSTNSKAREEALRGAKEGTIIIADAQTRGRGRLGRPWESPPGMNLYASMILRPAIPLADAAAMPLLTGIAVAKGLGRSTGAAAGIKWPNDILVGGKKIAGILAEAEAAGERVRFIIMGVGVNVNVGADEMPSSLKETATSLRIVTGRELSRARVAAAVFEEMEEVYALFEEKGFAGRLRNEWNRLSVVNGKWATLSTLKESWAGKVLGIDEDGALLFQDEQGRTRRFIAGDVSLRY